MAAALAACRKDGEKKLNKSDVPNSFEESKQLIENISGSEIVKKLIEEKGLVGYLKCLEKMKIIVI